MFKLYNIFENLIMESVMRSKIVDAINKRQRVKITYRSDDPKKSDHTGERYIEVYTYGIRGKAPSDGESDDNVNSSGGYEAIRAYQLFGDTSSVKPMWKFFKVDNILSWEPVNSYFKTSIEQRDENHVDPRNGEPIQVNHNGDKHMSVIHAQVKFDDTHLAGYNSRKEKELRDADELERQKLRARTSQMANQRQQQYIEKQRQAAEKERADMEQRAQQTRDIQQQQMQQQKYPEQDYDYDEEDIDDDNEENTP